MPTEDMNKAFYDMLTKTGGNNHAIPFADLMYIDFEKYPHLMIAGTIGSGKTSVLHTMMLSLLCCSTPEDTQILFIDPKFIEFRRYKNLPCAMREPIVDLDESIKALTDIKDEMMGRYKYMLDNDIEEYPGCRIYIVIDELAELVFHNKTVINILSSIARLGRACKINIIACTQHPTRSLLSPQIMTNFDAKICLHCTDPLAYRTVLGRKPGWEPSAPGEAVVMVGNDMYYTTCIYTTRADYDDCVSRAHYFEM